MAYRDNVSALAARYGMSNDPHLKESELAIETLRFTTPSGEQTTIQATKMNMGSRLFFQHVAGDANRARPSLFALDDYLLARAERYFAELWEPNPEPGKRPLLDALRSAASVEIFWK